VVINIPGMPGFDPRLPRVYKWDEERQCISGAVITFVDDGRATGKDKEHSWQVSHRCATKLQFLGIQIAIHKWRPPHATEAGAWAGMILKAFRDRVIQMITQAKWDKGREILIKLGNEIAESTDGKVDYKNLERGRGFMIHVSVTYPQVTPFLKGWHLTIDSWRANRQVDGWKMSSKDWAAYLGSIEDDDLRDEVADLGSKDHPVRVSAAPRLQNDVKVLQRMFTSPTSTELCVRSSRVLQVIYGMGDASGEGFGDSFLTKAGVSIHTGTWTYDIQNQSSNFREFRNPLNALRKEGEGGRLKNAFVIFGTDNSTVEAALYNGTSSSPLLLEMVEEFHALQMEFGFSAIVSWVSGERMIASGNDGLSRGVFNEGVAAGEDILSFLPFQHRSALEREPHLEVWLKFWLGADAEFLSPEDWFTRGHGIDGGEIGPDKHWRPNVRPGVFVWSPPPAACDVALEELRKARLKRQDSTHIFLVPKLMTPRWMKQFFKTMDLKLIVPTGVSYWPANMFEDCYLGVCFPFVRCDPWAIRATPKVQWARRTVQEMWKEGKMDPGDLLRKLLLECRRLPKLRRDVVRRLLYFEPSR
jgi:hypothetical protein